MPASLTSFKATVEKLIHRFESDRTHYLSKSYSEAQARVDFITPFFKALDLMAVALATVIGTSRENRD